MIKTISAKNFLSWESLNFDIPNGLTLIEGWNHDDQTAEGTGKSAILNAISWGLYGKLPKDTNIDEVLKEGTTTCKVTVKFQDGTSITRSRSPNTIEFLKEGITKVSGKDQKETQKLIEDWLGISFDAFCQTIYFAQNYPRKFIVSNQEEKAKILSEIQNLEVFDKGVKLLKDLGREVEIKSGSLKSQLQKLDYEIQLINKDRQALEERFAYTKDIHTKELTETSAEFDEVSADIELLKGVVETFESIDTSKLIEHRSALQKEKEQLLVQKQEVSFKRLTLEKELRDFQKQKDLADKVLVKLKSLETERDVVLNKINSDHAVCPTCEQALDANKELVRATQEALYETRISREQEVINNFSLLISPDPSELDYHATTELRFKERELVVLDALQHVEKDITAAGKREAVLQQIQRSTDQLTKLKERITLLAIKEPQFPILELNAIDEKIGTKRFEVDQIKTEIQTAEKKGNQYDALKQAFKSTKSYVFISLLNELSFRTNKYLEELFEIPVELTFVNNDLKIETVFKFNGESRSLGLLSGGQFRRVCLAVDLALSDIISLRGRNKLQIIICDEIMKDLSEASMEKVVNIFQQINRPVLIVEHNSIFKSFVNNKVLVSLKNGTSSFV